MIRLKRSSSEYRNRVKMRSAAVRNSWALESSAGMNVGIFWRNLSSASACFRWISCNSWISSLSDIVEREDTVGEDRSTTSLLAEVDVLGF